MTERVGPSRRTHVVLPPNSWYSTPDTDIEPLTPKNFKRMPAPRCVAYRAAGSTAGGALLERFEEFSGELPRHAVDQPRADLRELAAHGGLGVVGEPRRAAFRRERHRRLALGEPRHAALALEAELVAARRIDVRHLHPALELGADRSDLRGHHDVILVVRDPGNGLAAGYAVLEDVGIVERLPGLL